jgi:hypothetical protein
MPRRAIAAVKVDVVADAEEIGALLPKWCRETSTDFSVAQLSESIIEAENAFLTQRNGDGKTLEHFGVAAGIVCPECGGSSGE